MSLYHRQETVFKTDANGNPTWAESYTVTVYPVGARANAASSDTTIPVDAGHSFVVGDKVYNYTDGVFSGTNVVASVTATQITMASSFTVASGDLLVNLGPDGGTATPNFDASPMAIFSDPDGGTAVSTAALTTDAFGMFQYWYRGDGAAWELTRTGTTVMGLVRGHGGQSDRHNVADFGAKIDGSTDDVKRLQSALLAGGRVFVPAGSTVVTASLTIYDNGTLFGEGPTSKIVFNQTGTPNAGIVNNTNAGDITIRDLYIDHDGNTAASTTSAIHLSTGTGSNYLIENVYISDAGLDGIRVVGGSGTVTGARVLGNTIVTTDRHGIEFAADVSNSLIQGNRLRSCNTVTVGAAIYAGSAATSNNISVTGNVVEAFEDNGIRTIGTDVTISGNVVDGESVAGSVDGIRIAGSRNVASGNVVRRCTETGIKAENGKDMTISGNTSTGNAQYGIMCRFTTDYPEYVAISGNTCSSNTLDGIIVFGGKNIQITGNISRLNTNHGIRIEGGDVSAAGKICDFINVTGNTFYGNGTSHNDITVTVTDSGSIGTVKVSGNFCDGAGTGNGGVNILDAGTLVEVTDNHSANHVTSDLSIVTGVYFRHRGTGAPTLGAKNGSVWYRTDGVANEALYIRENTAWVEVGAA